jgi:hypothetical protein
MRSYFAFSAGVGLIFGTFQDTVNPVLMNLFCPYNTLYLKKVV